MSIVKTRPHYVIAILLALALNVHAQFNTGIIRGVVTDKTGAVVPGAIVKLTNPITNYTQTTIIDGQGVYRLIDVPFNDYKLTVENAGFEPVAREVAVRSNLAQQIDVQLGVAPVKQEVNISATGALI